jgi:hypothetical protein
MYLYLLHLILKWHDLQLPACTILKRLRKTTKACQASQSPQLHRLCKWQTSINSRKTCVCVCPPSCLTSQKVYKYFYCGAVQRILTDRPPLCEPSFPVFSLLYPHSSNPTGWITRSTLALGEGCQQASYDGKVEEYAFPFFQPPGLVKLFGRLSCNDTFDCGGGEPCWSR